MSRFIPVIISVVVLAALAFVAVTTLELLKPKPQQADEAPAGLSVFAEPVVRDDLVFTIVAQGEVKPRSEIAMAPQISGRVSFVSPDFIDGGFIRKGQVLVRLEAADYELAIVRARSAVASAEQRLATQRAEAEIAIQDLENLGITNSSPLARREPQLAEAQAALDSAKAQLAEAELALRRTSVIAPFDGRVRQRSADLGQFVSPGMSLGRIFASDVVEVSLPITDDQLGQLGLPLAFAETRTARGPEVLFTANVAGQPRNWVGRITRTSAAVNAQTRLINVIAELDDPYGAGADNGAPMAPGLFVTATVEGGRVEGLLRAPRDAIRSGNQIYLGDAKAGQLRLLPVDVVYSSPEGAWFRSDQVKIGDLAITSPIQAAFDGMTIKVLERQADGTIFTHEPEKKAAPAPVAEIEGAAVSGTEGE